MRTLIVIALLLAVVPPAASEDLKAATAARAALSELALLAPSVEPERQQTEAERERLERERERQREQAERERERLQQQRERQREQAERERERLQQERERQREQAERERERQREQAERERERAREQAERDRERAARERNCPIQEVERSTRTLRIGGKGELHLSNVTGDIVVSRGSGNEAAIEIIKTACGRTSEDAREMLKLVNVDIVERAARAEVTTQYPHGDEMRRTNRRNVNVSVAYNVTVPAATRVRAHSISGSVSATNVTGDIVLKSVSGAIRFGNGGGACTAESISGSVEVTGSAFDGAMSASSASGSIVLKRVKARRISASSISGNVTLDEAVAPAVDAKSVSGSVQLNGALTRNSRYELGSHSGSVSVMVAGGTGFEVQATSFSGAVRSDIQFTTRDSDSGRGRFNRTIRGVVGDGSAVLNLSTFSGSIVIGKQ